MGFAAADEQHGLMQATGEVLGASCLQRTPYTNANTYAECALSFWVLCRTKVLLLPQRIPEHSAGQLSPSLVPCQNAYSAWHAF